MTIDKKVITPNDMGTGLIYDDTAKQYKAVSQVVFRKGGATVDLLLNDMQLIFRELANSNRSMICTGVKYQGQWYGDAPDDTEFNDPFKGGTSSGLQAIDDIYARKNGDETFSSISTGDFRTKTKKVTLTAPALHRSATVDTGIAWDKYVSIFVRVKISDTSCELFNNISYTTNSANTELTILNNATSRFNGKEMTLYITYET